MEQDSQLSARDDCSWGTFLGRALGDHWAVAMPFDPNPKVTEKQLRMINHNKFPREALVEAALRVALKKLGGRDLNRAVVYTRPGGARLRRHGRDHPTWTSSA